MQQAFSRTIILADDLTGALEMGVLARQADHRSLVLLGHLGAATSLVDAPAISIDCGNRDLPAQEAIATLRQVAAGFPDSEGLVVLKKTDSLLRGHIGAELAALRMLYPRRRVVYVPAYPLLGRRVRNGELLIATDAREVSLGNVEALLSTVFPGSEIDRIPGPHELERALVAGEHPVLLCDGETQETVDAMGHILRGWLQHVIVAGPAGVFRALFPPGYSPQSRLPRVPNGVGFLGSVHPVSDAQWEALLASGCAMSLDANHTQFRRYLGAWESARQRGQWLMLRAQPAGDAAPSMDFHPLPDALFLSGGSTAAACLRLLPCRQLEPVRELEPGIVLSKARIEGRPLWVVTKSGAFGDAQTLVRILAMLQKGSPAA